MRVSIGLTVVAAGLSYAVPTKKEPPSTGLSDVEILNYALTLEHLEDTFYAQALANYTAEDFAAAGYDDVFYKNLKLIAYDESTHVRFITEALQQIGEKAAKACTYAFPATDVKSFLALASVLEGVGVSAYIGAAASIMEKQYVTNAASILSIEARHSAYIRSENGQLPFPQSFDNPLTVHEVYTLAAQFIVSCPPENPPLPLKAFPTLVAAPAAPAIIKDGDTITLSTPGTAIELKNGAKLYAAFITILGPIIGEVKKTDAGYETVVPTGAGINGQSYVVLTSCKDPGKVGDDNVVAGPAIVELSN